MPLIRPFQDKSPLIAPSCFIADNATVIGDVHLGEDSSIWYGAVLRGDVGKIRIGQRTNIQDLACVHLTTGLSSSILGDDVTVGHGAIIHGAIVGNGSLIGMGALLLDNAEIGEEVLVGAGSLVTANTKIPPRTMVMGRPAKVVKELSEQQLMILRASAPHYVELSRQHAGTAIETVKV